MKCKRRLVIGLGDKAADHYEEMEKIIGARTDTEFFEKAVEAITWIVRYQTFGGKIEAYPGPDDPEFPECFKNGWGRELYTPYAKKTEAAEAYFRNAIAKNAAKKA